MIRHPARSLSLCLALVCGSTAVPAPSRAGWDPADFACSAGIDGLAGRGGGA